jgi:hypothetical protein
MLLINFAILALALLLAYEAGRAIFRRRPKGDPPAGPDLVGVASGLLALLIGFTFAMSAERYQTRRDLVVAEANALGTTYLRDSLLPTQFSANLDGLLAQYGQARLAFFDAREDAKRLARASRRTGELQDAIWRETSLGLRANQSGPLATAILTSTNELFDLAATRQAALEAQVPTAVFWLLALTGIATAALTGYGLGHRPRDHRPSVTVLLLVVACSIALVEDLDMPRSGLITVPQAPLIRQVADLQAHEIRRPSFTAPDAPARPTP